MTPSESRPTLDSISERLYYQTALLGSHVAYEEAKEKTMAEGINTDKVIVNAGGGERGDNGNMAAIIAALGNRNQGNDNAALIAALGNRNEKDWGPLMALMATRDRDHGYGGCYDGFGGNSMWPLLLLALAGRGRHGGFLGGDDDGDGGCCAKTALTQTILEAVGDIKAQVPQVALESQNAVQASIAQLALGTQQGLGNVKDAVQALSLFQTQQLNNINQNVSEQGCKTRETVQESKTAILQAIAENKYENLKNELFELRGKFHSRDSEVSVNQTVNQVQAQAQAQVQRQSELDLLFHRLNASIGQQMKAKADQDIINLGTMLASGTQTPTNVNQK